MRDILEALRLDLLEQLPYLGGCEVIEGQDLPPASMPLPFIGLKDGGILHQSAPGQTDDDTGLIEIYLYQAISGPDAGAAIMGLGEEKGLLEIAAEVRGRVNDNTLGIGLGFFHLDREFASEPGLNPEDVWIQMQQLVARFERVTS